MASILKPAFAYYNKRYQARPILTICTTNAILAGISDTLTQKYLAPSSSFSASTDAREELAQDIEHTLWHEPTDQSQSTTSDLVLSKVGQAKDRMGQVAYEGKEAVDSKRSKQEQQTLSQKIYEAKDTIRNTVAESQEKVRDSARSAKGAVKESAESTKDLVKGSAQSTKDNVEAAADNAKTFGQQTAKEIKGRGFEGTKDMGEGYVKAGQESVESGKQAVREKLHDLTLESTPSLDTSRLGRFMLYNFSVAPLIHTWYALLDKNFPVLKATAPHTTTHVGRPGAMNPTLPASKIAQTLTPGLKRMVADQALFAPVGLALLFSGLTVLEGGGLKEIKAKLNSTYIDTLKANYMVWPLVQLVNFSVMPLQLRLPFVSTVGIAWNAYLSFMNTRGQEAQKRELKRVHNDLTIAS